jgi:hypothetical protein
MLKWKTKILLGGIETVYGAGKELTGADAMLVHNLSITAFQAEQVQRERTGRLGAYEKLHVGQHVAIEFDVPLSGSGTANAPAKIDTILRMCRMAATIVGPSPGPAKVKYELIDDEEESGAFHFLLAKTERHRIHGVRGSWGLRIQGSQLPMLHFSGLGLYETPTSVSAVTQNYAGWVNALPVSAANSAINLRGYVPRLRELSIDLGAQLVFRDLVGTQEIAIVDHEVTGSVTVEAPKLSDKNYFAEVESATPLEGASTALTFTHGATAGNIFAATFPRVQLSNPRYGEADGITTLQMDLTAVPTDAGLDEVEFATS